MPNSGGVPENQTKPGQITTTIKNKDGEWVSWDLVREACDVPSNRRRDPSFLTVSEAARHFKLSIQAISARAKRERWRLLLHTDKVRLLEDQEKDWGKKGEKHREKAFHIAHESLKKFKPKKPQNFKELEIVDRIARKAAGLEQESVVQQTLVHINEAVEDHANQVIEATVVEDPQPQLP